MFDFQPDESVADDFLFPMTSRLSYTSSAESDGEFCEAETPKNMSRQPSAEPGLSRFSSDPNLADPAKDNNKDPVGGGVPDYNALPANSIASPVRRYFTSFFNYCLSI